MLKIYENIKQLRLGLGLSQEELAKKVGYKDRSSVAKVESGEVDLSQSKIKAFADALETTPAYLMGWEDAEIKTEEDEKNAKVIVFEGGSMFDLDKLPDGTKEDLSKVVQILHYEYSDDDFKLQVILDKEEILNLDALPLDKKKDLMKYIRFLLSDEK